MNRFLALLLGIGLLFAGMYFGKQTLALKRDGVAAIGTVVDQRTRRTVSISDSSVDYSVTRAPIVEFVSDSGKTFRFQSKLWSRSSDKVGSQVNVLYERDHPEDARINGFFENWLASLILALIGGSLLLYATGIIQESPENVGRSWSFTSED